MKFHGRLAKGRLPLDGTLLHLMALDGSMKYGPVWELRRTGCAVVVVSVSGDLVAFGNAVPPSCVRTAAASELWALLVVLSATVAPPPIFTDCMSLLTAAACGSAPERAAGLERGTAR